MADDYIPFSAADQALFFSVMTITTGFHATREDTRMWVRILNSVLPHVTQSNPRLTRLIEAAEGLVMYHKKGGADWSNQVWMAERAVHGFARYRAAVAQDSFNQQHERV